MHTKEATHQSAEGSSTYLNILCCRQFYFLAEHRKIDTDDYQRHAQNPLQDVVSDAQQEYGYHDTTHSFLDIYMIEIGKANVHQFFVNGKDFIR